MSAVRCKPRANPHDSSELPLFPPAGLTPYVLNTYAYKSPAYHVTEDDVTTSIDRLEVDNITSHRPERVRGGVVTVLYETHWKGLLQPSSEREMGLQHFRQHVLGSWAATPLQLQQAIRLCRRMLVGAVQRELSRDWGARLLSPGYSLVTNQD